VNEFDRRLAALGRTEIDHDLSGIEDAVWARINAQDRCGLRPMPRLMASALCAGIALVSSLAGEVAAASQSSPQPLAFAIEAPLGPSTILGD
jgi:hypothetical protein